MRAVFVYNPAAARCSADLESRIRRRFPAAAAWATRGPGDGARLGARAVEEGAELVVACGGDGTFREVATGVGARAALGLVPVGTVNLLAAELDLPSNPEDALAVVERGRQRRVYPGLCTPDGGGEATLFFLCVSVGPDADAVHAVRGEKRLLGRYAYALRFAFRVLRPVPDVVAWQREGATGRCGQLLALRLPHYAGNYRVSETCSLFAPGLEVVAVHGGRPRLAAFLLRALRDRVGPVRGVHRFSAQELTVRLPAPGKLQVDGDPLTAPGFSVSAVGAPLRVVGS